MALVLLDRAQETATANTTVSFTLTGASTGYQTLAGVGNGNTTYYGATDGTNWETGIGTYSTTGPTLTRTTILASSNSGSAVTFSGAVTVWVDYPASKSVGSQTGYFDSNYAGTFVDGIVVDYDSGSSLGRLSVGSGDGIGFYNGGVAGFLLGSASSAGDWSLTRFLDVGNGTLVGGATNPIIAAAGSSTGYVQMYIHNDNNSTSASSDIAAYPDNGTDASGWIDMGITSSTYNDSSYLITGANEGYIFMSAPSGAGKSGNLVYATDSTGTSNAHQWYSGGFNAAKNSWEMQLNSTGLALNVPLTSNVTTGTAPFVVASTTQVANLNAATAGTAGNVTGIVLGANGGTGVANTGKTITLGGNLTTSGAFGTTLTVGATTSLTLPASGTVLSSVTAPAANPITGTPSSSNYLRGDGTWATVTAGAGGSNTQVQYNSSGALAGSANLTFDGTTLTGTFSGAHNGTVGATTPTTGKFTTITQSAGTSGVGGAPIYLTTGTNLTAAAQGAIEFDGVAKYFTPFGTSRGFAPTYQIQALTATYTLTSQTAAQKLLNATTNGAVAVSTGLYEFECQFFLTGMSATASTFGFALGGTATKTEQWMAMAAKSGTTATAITTGNANAMYTTNNTAANTAICGSSTNTAGGALIKGFIRVTVAGTIIPQVSLSIAAAAVVQTGAYFKITPISATSTTTSIGNWT
jgi:hypothetical protein